MEYRQIVTQYAEYRDLDELSAADRNLMEQAIVAAHSAYAPYSGFRVGAALLLKNGEVVCGNNQENAAYPSGMCGERVAMFSASAQYPGIAFDCLAIYACSDKISVDDVVTPCGSCRQVMAEYFHAREKDFRVILKGENSPVIIFESIDGLLPLMFSPKHLQ